MQSFLLIVSRRATRATFVLLLALVILSAALNVLWSATTLSGFITPMVSRQVADRYDIQLKFDSVGLNSDLTLCMNHVQLERAVQRFALQLEAPQVCINNWWSLLMSPDSAVPSLRLESPLVTLRPASRRANPTLTSVSARTAPNRARSSTTNSASSINLPAIHIEFEDMELNWANLALPSQLPSQGQLSGLSGQYEPPGTLTIEKQPEDARIKVAFESKQTTWKIHTNIDGNISAFLPELQLPWDIHIKHLESLGTITAESALSGNLRVNLNLRHDKIDLECPWAAKNPFKDLYAEEHLSFILDQDSHRLKIEDGRIDVQGVPFEIALKLSDYKASNPRFSVGVELKNAPISRVLSISPEPERTPFANKIGDAILAKAQFKMNGQLEDPSTWSPHLNYNITIPEQVSTGLETFEDNFLYFPLTADGLSETAVVLGPETDHWLTYTNIPSALRASIMASEDGTFMRHQGIELEEVKHAIESQIQGGRLRGGSTISQQLVKNLFLSRDRTAIRKLQEAVLTFLLETHLGKKKIFELYANVIEWGPRIFGAQAASFHYFGTDVNNLNHAELAFLTIIIPSPIRYHQYHRLGTIPSFLRRKVDRLLDKLYRLGYLTADQFEEALAQTIQFAPHISHNFEEFIDDYEDED